MTVCAARLSAQREGKDRNVPGHSLMPTVVRRWVDREGQTHKPAVFAF